MFNYPNIATFVNNITANREVSEYQEIVDSKAEEELAAMMDKAKAYNASLPTNFPADPFSSQNINVFTGTDFENFEMVQPGATVGVVEIPKIDIYQPIYYGTSEEVLSKGIGLVENTSLPVGGEGSHAVISGHTGMATKKLFTDLTKMELKDVFFVHVLNEHFAYEVDQIKVVLPEETQDLAIEKDHDYVTLLTCTPFGINDHRLLVRGTRIDYNFIVQPEEHHQTIISGEVNKNVRRWIMAFGGAGIFLLLVLIMIAHDARKRRKLRIAEGDGNGPQRNGPQKNGSQRNGSQRNGSQGPSGWFPEKGKAAYLASASGNAAAMEIAGNKSKAEEIIRILSGM